MVSDAKNKRAMGTESFLSDMQQLNTYFPFYYGAVFAQISRMRKRKGTRYLHQIILFIHLTLQD